MRWTDLPAASPVRTFDAWVAGPGASLLPAIIDRIRPSDARQAGPLVVLAAAARREAMKHIARHGVERGGLLAGVPVGASPDAIALVHVTRAIPGVVDAATPLSLRLDAAVWNAAREALAPGECVVGWFHSHPGLGAFFSDTDRRTQAAFFAHAFSVGWVVDPLREEHAWFVGAASGALPEGAIIQLPGDH
jgi:proteasome lid subunit RPN8/RPN11